MEMKENEGMKMNEINENEFVYFVYMYIFQRDLTRQCLQYFTNSIKYCTEYNKWKINESE